MKNFLKTIIVTVILVAGVASAQAEPSTYLPGYDNWAQGAFGQK